MLSAGLTGGVGAGTVSWLRLLLGKRKGRQRRSRRRFPNIKTTQREDLRKPLSNCAFNDKSAYRSDNAIDPLREKT